MLVKWAKGWRREIRLEHSPFLTSSAKGMDGGIIDGTTWLVTVINKWPLKIIGSTEQYWFGGDAAFRQADDYFVHLVTEDLALPPAPTEITNLNLGQVKRE